MRPELAEALTKDFPALYARGSQRQRFFLRAEGKKPGIDLVNVYGFEVEDGWEPLIRELSQQIQPAIAQEITSLGGEDGPCIYQVKQKFGALKFYMVGRWTNPEALRATKEAINAAEARSKTVCEWCASEGASGHLTRSRGSILTLCLPCQVKREKEKT